MDPAPGIRVLVVDDDFAVAEVHRAYVEGVAGFSVVAVAHTGAQALHATRELHPDLVLLDIHLPDISGLEVLQRLRADPATKDIPVVVTSADATQGQIDRLMAAGADDYLTKPLDVPQFVEAVRKRLE
jgi:CheY-like chemotaxis protein